MKRRVVIIFCLMIGLGGPGRSLGWANNFDSAEIPVKANLDEVLAFTVHEPLRFDLFPSPVDTQRATGELEVATNAEGGYTISVMIDYQLTEEADLSPDVIPAWEGSVFQPTPWPDDQTGFGLSLDGGQSYAGLPTAETILISEEQTNGQIWPIDYRVTVDNSFDAGSYSAMITYTALASF